MDASRGENSVSESWIVKLVDEAGVKTLINTSIDCKILISQRLVRHLAYSISTLILAAFLQEAGLSSTSIGLFMTLTLVGDLLISFGMTLVADGIGRRSILLLGAALMTISGLVFALTTNHWLLLTAAVFGVITPSGNEIGPFKAIEESIIAHLTTDDKRASIFAWYTLVGNLGTAIGFVVCGWITTSLVVHQKWTKINSYRLIFLLYAALGAVKLFMTFFLTPACEVDKPEAQNDLQESVPLTSEEETPPVKGKTNLLPSLSQHSRKVLLQLCLLMGLDSFASGLAAKSWIAYYFAEHFSVSDSIIGTLFFVSSIISAVSVLVAASIARRIGNIKTMVFTHLPSSLFLAMIGVPSEMWLSALFLILRSCTQQMDSAPRSAFLAAIVLPNERTAVMGTVNTAKTIGQTLGPFLAGLLIDKHLFWFVFVLAAGLKALYDVRMLVMFAQSISRQELDLERS